MSDDNSSSEVPFDFTPYLKYGQHRPIDNLKSKDSAQCNVCGKTYSRKGRTTTPLKNHLRSIHPEMYSLFLSADGERNSKDNTINDANDPKSEDEGEISKDLEDVSNVPYKIHKEFIRYGFVKCDRGGTPCARCIICNLTYSNLSARPRRMQKHLDERHSEYKDKGANFFKQYIIKKALEEDSQSNSNEPSTSKDEENESDVNRSQSPEEPSAEPKDVNCSVYGKYVATQLQETPKLQRILAERLINEVLFLSRMGKLTELHSIVSRVENSRETNSKIVNNQVATNASSSVTKGFEENKVEPEESYITKLKKELKTKYSANADQRDADAKRAKRTTAATDSRPAPADVPAFLNTKQIFLTEPENPDYLSINGKLVKILKGTDNASYVIINGQPVNLAHLQCTTPSLYLNTLNIEKKKKSISPPSQPQLEQSQPNLAPNIIHTQPKLAPNILHTQPNLAPNIIHTQPNLAPNIIHTQPNLAPNIMQNVKFTTVPVERTNPDEPITIKDEPVDVEVKQEPMADT